MQRIERGIKKLESIGMVRHLQYTASDITNQPARWRPSFQCPVSSVQWLPDLAVVMFQLSTFILVGNNGWTQVSGNSSVTEWFWPETKEALIVNMCSLISVSWVILNESTTYNIELLNSNKKTILNHSEIAYTVLSEHERGRRREERGERGEERRGETRHTLLHSEIITSLFALQALWM